MVGVPFFFIAAQDLTWLPALGDGMIRLTKEEYECLLFHPSGEDEANKQLGEFLIYGIAMTILTSGQGTIRVANNLTSSQALQINGFVDDDWKEFTHNLTVEHNEARDQGIQVNVPIKRDIFDQLLVERRVTLQTMAVPRQWPQPPPMPQQPMSGLPQAWPSPP